MIKAIKLYLKEGTTFDLLFSDGITKRYNILFLSKKYPQLNELTNRALFLKGHLLGNCAVVWNDELDIDVETVYEDGVAVENSDNIPLILLGFQIKEERKALQLTQQNLSILSGISQADISRLEKGELNPSILLLDRLAKCLNKQIAINFK